MFYFSPLSDYAMSAIDSWIRWSSDGKYDTARKVEALELLQQPPGASILLFWAIRQFERWSTVKCAKFVGGSELVAKEIYTAHALLNIDGYYAQLARYKTDETTGSNKSERNVDEAVYYDLIEKHGYTLDEVRRMTRVQQTLLWMGEPNKPQTANFATAEEYLEWNASRGRQ